MHYKDFHRAAPTLSAFSQRKRRLTTASQAVRNILRGKTAFRQDEDNVESFSSSGSVLLILAIRILLQRLTGCCWSLPLFHPCFQYVDNKARLGGACNICPTSKPLQRASSQHLALFSEILWFLQFFSSVSIARFIGIITNLSREMSSNRWLCQDSRINLLEVLNRPTTDVDFWTAFLSRTNGWLQPLKLYATYSGVKQLSGKPKTTWNRSALVEVL